MTERHTLVVSKEIFDEVKKMMEETFVLIENARKKMDEAWDTLCALESKVKDVVL